MGIMVRIDEASLETVLRVFIACNGAYLMGLCYYLLRRNWRRDLGKPILFLTLSYLLMTFGAIIALYVGALSPLRMVIVMISLTLGDIGLTQLSRRDRG